jgi:hypothetical protein
MPELPKSNLTCAPRAHPDRAHHYCRAGVLAHHRAASVRIHAAAAGLRVNAIDRRANTWSRAERQIVSCAYTFPLIHLKMSAN